MNPSCQTPEQGMGNLKSRGRFPAEMHGLRPSDHGAEENGRKKYEEFAKKRIIVLYSFEKIC